MSPVPGRILEVIDIDIPRPRGLDVTSSARFGELAGQIRRFFSADMFLSAVVKES
jgi:NitT/TauT family transport system ATP-binding protein